MHPQTRSRHPTRRNFAGRSRVAAVCLSLLLGACAGELSTQTEALRLLTAELPEAVVNEQYSAPLIATGGLRPYEFTLESGRLPAGLSLVNGNLQGVPTQLGVHSFTVRVSDANLSQFMNDYELRVVEVPPTALTLRVPETEVRSALTLRARVTEARALRGLRTVITWDPAAYQLREGSVTAVRRGLALFHESEPGVLRVDLAVLAGQGPGASSDVSAAADLFSFVLEPLQPPAQIAVSALTEFVSTRSSVQSSEVAETVEGAPAARLALARTGSQPTTDGSEPQEPSGGSDGEPGNEPGDEPEDEPGDAPEDEGPGKGSDGDDG